MENLSENPVENSIDDLIDFSALRKKISDCDGGSTADQIKLLKMPTGGPEIFIAHFDD